MTSLDYTEARYVLLAKVDRQIVLLHDSCEAHPQGFSWDGAEMSQDIQDVLEAFRHAGLIEIGRHWPWGSAVSLSDAGITCLAQWRAQRMAGSRGVA